MIIDDGPSSHALLDGLILAVSLDFVAAFTVVELSVHGLPIVVSALLAMPALVGAV